MEDVTITLSDYARERLSPALKPYPFDEPKLAFNASLFPDITKSDLLLIQYIDDVRSVTLTKELSDADSLLLLSPNSKLEGLLLDNTSFSMDVARRLLGFEELHHLILLNGGDHERFGPNEECGLDFFVSKYKPKSTDFQLILDGNGLEYELLKNFPKRSSVAGLTVARKLPVAVVLNLFNNSSLVSLGCTGVEDPESIKGLEILSEKYSIEHSQNKLVICLKE